MDASKLPFKVSVIIPNYNQGRFVEEAVQSVLSQDYLNKEIVIVDDASTDDSVEVIEEMLARLNNPTITFIKRPINGGTAATRNEGIKHSKAPILAFLDADDFYLPNKISYSVGKLVQKNGIGVVYSDYYTKNEQTGQTYREIKSPFRFDHLLSYCMVSTNSVVHRAVFDKLGLFNESIRGMEDYEFWLRAATQYMLLHIPLPLFVYRNHGANKTETTNRTAWLKEEQSMKQAFAEKYLV